MPQNPESTRVINTSALVLGAVWLVALSSIPSAQNYQQQLDSGVAARDISTIYSSLLLLVTLAQISAWFATVKWMQLRYQERVKVAPSSMRLSYRWVTWCWIVPIVSLWYPKRMIDDLVNATPSSPTPSGASDNSEPINTRLWWATWITYSLMTNLTTLQMALLPENTVPFKPSNEIAGACILTACFTVWVRIIRKIG